MTIARYKASATEAQMLKTFTDLAERGGGYVWHARRSEGQQLDGMPDVLIALPPTFGAFELKTQRDTVSALQRDVLAVLEACDMFVSGIVRPRPKAGELTLDQALSKMVCFRDDLILEDEIP